MEQRSGPNDDQAQHWNGPEAGRGLRPCGRLFLKATGIGQTLLRGVDAATINQITAAAQRALEPYLTSDGVRLESRAWLVTTRGSR